MGISFALQLYGCLMKSFYGSASGYLYVNYPSNGPGIILFNSFGLLLNLHPMLESGMAGRI